MICFHLQLMYHVYIKHKHATPANVHTEVTWSSFYNWEFTSYKCHCVKKKCLKKRLNCTPIHIFLSSLFVWPNGLHVRSNLAPYLTYDILTGKIYFICRLALNTNFVFYFIYFSKTNKKIKDTVLQRQNKTKNEIHKQEKVGRDSEFLAPKINKCAATNIFHVYFYIKKILFQA